MRVNVYDFDKTIYDGDSTLDFYLYCIKKNVCLLRYLPFQIFALVLYLLKIIDKTECKERIYIFLAGIYDIDEYIISFWDNNECKMKEWYLNQKQETDVIISASPSFLLNEICQRLDIKNLIASEVNKQTGIYTGENCYGKEKVRLFREKYEGWEIKNFYSDSLSDTPLAKVAEQSYIVNKNKIEKWRMVE